MDFFSHLFHHWKELLRDRRYVLSLLTGIVLLFIALYANFLASSYRDSIPSLSVNDLILDYLPTTDLSFFYITGIYVVIILFVFYPILFQPEIAPFTAKTVAAFILIRSFFLTLTHLGAPPDYYEFLPRFGEERGVFRLFYLNDLFFSGHTGLPFLGALIFWENKIMRYFLLLMSMVLAVTVLFMHAHYSIDVFSAYFITYGIYVVSDKIFNKLNLAFRRTLIEFEKRMLKNEKIQRRE